MRARERENRIKMLIARKRECVSVLCGSILRFSAVRGPRARRCDDRHIRYIKKTRGLAPRMGSLGRPQSAARGGKIQNTGGLHGARRSPHGHATLIRFLASEHTFARVGGGIAPSHLCVFIKCQPSAGAAASLGWS